MASLCHMQEPILSLVVQCSSVTITINRYTTIIVQTCGYIRSESDTLWLKDKLLYTNSFNIHLTIKQPMTCALYIYTIHQDTVKHKAKKMIYRDNFYEATNPSASHQCISRFFHLIGRLMRWNTLHVIVLDSSWWGYIPTHSKLGILIVTDTLHTIHGLHRWPV